MELVKEVTNYNIFYYCLNNGRKTLYATVSASKRINNVRPEELVTVTINISKSIRFDKSHNLIEKAFNADKKYCERNQVVLAEMQKFVNSLKYWR